MAVRAHCIVRAGKLHVGMDVLRPWLLQVVLLAVGRNGLEVLVRFAPRLTVSIQQCTVVDSWLSAKSWRWVCLSPKQNADHDCAL